jgi:hypothetical protein
MRVLKDYATTVSNTITTDTTVSVQLDNADRGSIQCVLTVNAPAAATFVAVAATDICTQAAHGYVTGLKVQLTTTTTLPAGLSLATDYFIVKLTADTYQLAVSLANAVLATPTVVNITGTGTGTHTATPVALAGGKIKLQKSNDNVTWDDEVADANVTATSDVWFIITPAIACVKYLRVRTTLTAGMLSGVFNVITRG